MARKRPTFDLKVLDRVAQALAEATDFKEVKSLRDKAEAARQYAKNAAIGLKIQNKAAELKLRAERRAGEILRELVPHGGNRRSSRHDGDLKLSDLGINSGQSSRWRREAAVPEGVFEQYVALANQLGHDITSQGLLKLEKKVKNSRGLKGRRKSGSDRGNIVIDSGRIDSLKGSDSCRRGSAAAVPYSETDSLSFPEMLAELTNHRNLLADVLEPISNGECDSALCNSQRRIIARLLAEMDALIRRLEKAWKAG